MPDPDKVSIPADEYKAILSEKFRDQVLARIWDKLRMPLAYLGAPSLVGLAVLGWSYITSIPANLQTEMQKSLASSRQDIERGVAEAVKKDLDAQVALIIARQASVLGAAQSQLRDQIAASVPEVLDRTLQSDQVQADIGDRITAAVAARVDRYGLADALTAERSAALVANHSLPPTLRLSLLGDLAVGDDGPERMVRAFASLVQPGAARTADERIFVADAARAVLGLLPPGRAGDANRPDHRRIVVEALLEWCAGLARPAGEITGTFDEHVAQALAAIRAEDRLPAHIDQLRQTVQSQAARAPSCARATASGLGGIGTNRALVALLELASAPDSAVQNAAWVGMAALPNPLPIEAAERLARLRDFIALQATALPAPGMHAAVLLYARISYLVDRRQWSLAAQEVDALWQLLGGPSDQSPLRRAQRALEALADETGPADLQERAFRRALSAMLARPALAPLGQWADRTRQLGRLLDVADRSRREAERAAVLRDLMQGPGAARAPAAALAVLLTAWAAALDQQAAGEAADLWITLATALEEYRRAEAALGEPMLAWAMLAGRVGAATPLVRIEPDRCARVLNTALGGLHATPDPARSMLVAASFSCLAQPARGTQLAEALAPLADVAAGVRASAAAGIVAGLPVGDAEPASAPGAVDLIGYAAERLRAAASSPAEAPAHERMLARHLVAVAFAAAGDRRSQFAAEAVRRVGGSQLLAVLDEADAGAIPTNVTVAAREAMRSLFPWIEPGAAVRRLGTEALLPGCGYIHAENDPATLLVAAGAAGRHVLEIAAESDAEIGLMLTRLGQRQAEPAPVLRLSANRILRRIVTLEEGSVLALAGVPPATCASLRPLLHAAPGTPVGPGLWEVATPGTRGNAVRVPLRDAADARLRIVSLAWADDADRPAQPPRLRLAGPGVQELARDYAVAQVFRVLGPADVRGVLAGGRTLLIDVAALPMADQASGTVGLSLDATAPERWFRIVVPAGAHLRAETQGLSEHADTVLTLYDESLRQLASDDDGGTGRASLIERDAPAGQDTTYLLQAINLDEGYPEGAVRFELAVTIGQASAGAGR